MGRRATHGRSVVLPSLQKTPGKLLGGGYHSALDRGGNIPRPHPGAEAPAAACLQGGATELRCAASGRDSRELLENTAFPVARWVGTLRVCDSGCDCGRDFICPASLEDASHVALYGFPPGGRGREGCAFLGAWLAVTSAPLTLVPEEARL